MISLLYQWFPGLGRTVRCARCASALEASAAAPSVAAAAEASTYGHLKQCHSLCPMTNTHIKAYSPKIIRKSGWFRFRCLQTSWSLASLAWAANASPTALEGDTGSCNALRIIWPQGLTGSSVISSMWSNLESPSSLFLAFDLKHACWLQVPWQRRVLGISH